MREYLGIDETVMESLTKNYDRQMEKMRIVKKKEYFTWVIGFIEGRDAKAIDTESILYDETISQEIKEKLSFISDLFSLFEEFCRAYAIKQEIVEPEPISFSHGEYIFELEGYYFSIMTIVGQGAITILTRLTKAEAEKSCNFVIDGEAIWRE